MEWIDLRPILAPIQFAIVGAAATRLYMPERTTRDLDIVIRTQDAAAVRQKLAQAGFVYQGELSSGGSTWISPKGEAIDVLEGDETWWAAAIAEAQTNRDAQGLPILPLRYLVLSKFLAGRIQDIADVTRMLGQAEAQALDAVRALFTQYAPTEMEDLESLIALGKLEASDEARS